MNENRFLAENHILIQSKVKLRIKNGLFHVTGYWLYFEVNVVFFLNELKHIFNKKSLLIKQCFKAITDFNHGIENRMIYKV